MCVMIHVMLIDCHTHTSKSLQNKKCLQIILDNKYIICISHKDVYKRCDKQYWEYLPEIFCKTFCEVCNQNVSIKRFVNIWETILMFYQNVPSKCFVNI